MVQDIFVNLPVKNLPKSKEFFEKIGFSFNPQFTDDNGASLILGEHIYAMLITEEFFKTFITKEIADSSKVAEVINAVGVESRAKVDEIVDKAMDAGATKYKDTDDYGWMYIRRFQDLDGHLWEVAHMDLSQMPKE